MKTDQRRFTPYGQWVKAKNADQVYVGITTEAHQVLGEIVFLELPQVGDVVTRDQPCGFLESRKAVVDILSPLAGVVVEQNISWLTHLSHINQSPSQQQWLFTLQIDDIQQWYDLPVTPPGQSSDITQ